MPLHCIKVSIEADKRADRLSGDGSFVHSAFGNFRNILTHSAGVRYRLEPIDRSIDRSSDQAADMTVRENNTPEIRETFRVSELDKLSFSPQADAQTDKPTNQPTKQASNHQTVSHQVRASCQFYRLPAEFSTERLDSEARFLSQSSRVDFMIG